MLHLFWIVPLCFVFAIFVGKRRKASDSVGPNEMRDHF